MSDPVRDAATRVLEIEEIKRLRARYCYAADDQRFEDFRALFTDDAVIDFPMLDVTTPDGLVTNLAERTAGGRCMHLCHNPDIQVYDDGTATGRWALDVQVQRAPGSEYESLRMYGDYHEKYRMVDGQWLIAGLRLVLFRTEPMPAYSPLPSA